MNSLNAIAIVLSLLIMVRAAVLFRDAPLLPASLQTALQVVGVFAIIVTSLAIVSFARV
jgi:hypothetical protein